LNIETAIRQCIEKSTGKLTSARVLKDAKRLEDSIILYINAYEESGKADFLMSKLSFNEKVTRKEWKSLTGLGSHPDKILMYYLNRKKTLLKFQEDEWKGVKKIVLENPYPNESKEQTLSRLNVTLSILSKLNGLKKMLAYSDSLFEEKNLKELPEEDLISLAYLLDFEMEKSLFVTSLGLEVRELKPTNNTEKDVQRISQLPSMKKLQKLKELASTPSHNKTIERAVTILRVL